MLIVLFQLWNAVSEASLGVFRGHSGWVHCVAFSQDTCKLVSSSDDETVKVYSYTGPFLSFESPVACFSTHIANLLLCVYQQYWYLQAIFACSIKRKSSLVSCKRGYGLLPIMTALVIRCVDDYYNYSAEWKMLLSL